MSEKKKQKPTRRRVAGRKGTAPSNSEADRENRLDDLPLSLDDLIRSFVEDKSWVAHDTIKPPPRDAFCAHIRKRRELMAKLFGCNLGVAKRRLEKMAERDAPATTRHGIGPISDAYIELTQSYHPQCSLREFDECIESLRSSISSPWGGGTWLEGIPPKIARETREVYCNIWKAAVGMIERVRLDVARHILRYLFPGIESRRCTRSDLIALGLPREMPECEYDDFTCEPIMNWD